MSIKFQRILWCVSYDHVKMEATKVEASCYHFAIVAISSMHIKIAR